MKAPLWWAQVRDLHRSEGQQQRSSEACAGGLGHLGLSGLVDALSVVGLGFKGGVEENPNRVWGCEPLNP